PAGGTAGLAAGNTRFRSLRQFFAGLEHRWGKWVLDYDIDTQASLVERATSPFSDTANGERDTAPSPLRLWPLLTIAVLLVALILLLRRARLVRKRPVLADTRAYLRLRSAYEHAGFPSALQLPPLQFLDALGTAPGASHARVAVGLYVAARFGARELGPAERRQLAASVDAARRELRDSRRARV
ncbi:MAG TPA: hypothetical protein VK928_02000, partial [Longimicrobiales bacterium]|nr:hypothetical protein [Longimicrobiales bacterium]